MERYAKITTHLPREFVLLQGKGCRWAKCTFCDYHEDQSSHPYPLNRQVLQQVTGCYGVLDIINSGSAMELDEATLQLIAEIVKEKNIHTLWFEAHYMYRKQLADFAARFPSVTVKFRCGVESFDPEQRKKWNKGMPMDVTPADVAQYFQGVCLLCCTKGETRERILNDIALARQYFEYFSINLFCNNGTAMERDEQLAQWFEKEVYPALKDLSGIEVLLNNTDLGVG